MNSRMDKYNEDIEEKLSRTSRIERNELLYKEISNNKTYTEFTNLNEDNVYEIDMNNTKKTTRRSDNVRKSIFDTEYNDSNDSLSRTSTYSKILPPTGDKKDYDVNEVLERARRNREEMDEDEKKKKLKNVEYSILSDLNQEKLKEYHEKRERGITQEERDNIDELIHTITSNSLRKKIDDELLKDLLPDEEDETTVEEELEDDEELTQAKDESYDDEDTKEEELDDSFYTKSMDLKKEDLVIDRSELDDEIDESFKEGNGNLIKNIALIILVIAVLGIVGYIVYNFI